MQRKEKANFWRGFGRMDHIETLRELMRRTKEHEMPIALEFIDFEKAIDSIYPRTITEALVMQGVEKF